MGFYAQFGSSSLAPEKERWILTLLLGFRCGDVCSRRKQKDPILFQYLGNSQQTNERALGGQTSTPEQRSPLNSRWCPYSRFSCFALSSNHIPLQTGKAVNAYKTALYEFFFFSNILSKGDSRHISISTILVGSRSLSAGSTLFAVTLVARGVFVQTIRMPANGNCSFMLRSGKFNNALAGFMLSSENRMNMERDCDLKSSKSASPDVCNKQLLI